MTHSAPSRIALALASAACLCSAPAALALSPDWSGVDDSRLEALFWDCDLLSTQQALSGGDGALCAMAHDELKQRRFGGDFERLLDWWRSHKDDEHARRGAAASR
jgi:hypothetical protein